MYKVVTKRFLNDAKSICLFEVEAPLVARHAKAGQFVIFRLDEQGERVPVSVAGYDREKGTVTVMVQAAGKTTKMLHTVEQGDYISDFVGPLGKATEMEGLNKVCVVGGGVGCAIAYPIAKEMHERGIEVTFIGGFRSADIVILKDELKAVSDKLIMCTDDGTYGEKGFTTVFLKKEIEDNIHDGKPQFDRVIAIGPDIMMKFLADVTRPYGIRTIISLDPIMVDGTGMCGCCRVIVGGETKFACVDGPDFDAHQVDFDSLIKRAAFYTDEQHQSTSAILREGNAMANLKVNMSKTKNPMPEQDPVVRAGNFDEVALGYDADTAMKEAARCLDCKNSPCREGCPVAVKIPRFLEKVREGDFEAAYEIVTSTNSLPAVCGRVCPQEKQCESKCVRGLKGESVGIGRLERFVADWHMAREDKPEMTVPVPNGHRVAVIGSGPAGLTCAGDLCKMGYDVTIFEAFHKSGGVLVYGIPQFRLPKEIVAAEIENLTKMGVKIVNNAIIGKSITVDELFDDGFEAVFIGSGAGLPQFLRIPGENLLGVYSANELLTRTNLMKAYRDDYDTPIKHFHRVAVVGAGNVAMDAARVAKRLGAEHVYITYRRGRDELPARKEEVEHAEAEGIEFELLNNPCTIRGDEDGHVTGIELIRQELGEPDEKGRRKPVAIKDSNWVLDVDTVIIAIGTSPNPLIRNTTDGLTFTKKGGIEADEGGVTARPGVFAGGDAVTGSATVILAMGAGKAAAKSIDEYLRNKK